MSALALSSTVIAIVVAGIALLVISIAWGAASAHDDTEWLVKTSRNDRRRTRRTGNPATRRTWFRRSQALAADSPAALRRKGWAAGPAHALRRSCIRPDSHWVGIGGESKPRRHHLPRAPDVRHGDPSAHAASLSAIGYDAAVLMSIQAPMDEARKRALMPGIPEVGVQGVVGTA